MVDIVITEFMHAALVEDLARDYEVHCDTTLWSKREELERLVAGIPALIVRNRTRVDEALLARAPRLRVLGRLGVGLDNIDVAACKAAGVEVCPAVGANAVSVAEYVIGTAIMLVRGQALLSTQRLVSGEWPREDLGRGHEMAGRTMGIIGCGSIGQTLAARARHLDLKLIACDPYLPKDSPAWKMCEKVTLEGLLERSDIVTLHCPLTEETRGMIGAREMARMKSGTILINSARGGIVDEAACAAALRSGHLGGAALDVFDYEPIKPETGKAFAGIPNVILTPHIAGVTLECNERISVVTAANVRRALQRRR